MHICPYEIAWVLGSGEGIRFLIAILERLAKTLFLGGRMWKRTLKENRFGVYQMARLHTPMKNTLVLTML